MNYKTFEPYKQKRLDKRFANLTEKYVNNDFESTINSNSYRNKFGIFRYSSP